MAKSFEQLSSDSNAFVARMEIEAKLRDTTNTDLDDLYKLREEVRALPPAASMPKEYLWALLEQLTPDPQESEQRFRDIYQRAGRHIPPA
jgi:hypothetical protein